MFWLARDAMGRARPRRLGSQPKRRRGLIRGYGARERQRRARLPWPSPSYTRAQFHMVRNLLAQAAVGIVAIASETGLGRQASTASRTTPAGGGKPHWLLGKRKNPTRP